MKQYTLDEYTKIHDFDFYIYDETIEDYLMEEYDAINPESEEWERIKDEIIISIDETLNEKPTLYIATIAEKEEPEWWEGLSDEEIKEEWEAYHANLERDERGFHE